MDKQLYTGRKKIWSLDAEIPAGAQDYIISKTIDGKKIFSCRELGGSFETLIQINGSIVDDGVNRLRVKLQDGGRDYQFTDAYIPADLILSAGRRKSAKAMNNLTTAAAGNPIYKFLSFNYEFTDKIEARISNDSNTAQHITILFIGYETAQTNNIR
jgi:hypothetical protein